MFVEHATMVSLWLQEVVLPVPSHKIAKVVQLPMFVVNATLDIL